MGGAAWCDFRPARCRLTWSVSGCEHTNPCEPLHRKQPWNRLRSTSAFQPDRTAQRTDHFLQRPALAARSARCFLFALLVVLLPLQGFVAAVQRVSTPEHFHVLVATQGVVITGLKAGDVIETLQPREPATHAAGDAAQSDHAHAYGKVGVVYFNGDDNAAPGSGSRKHTAPFDVVLPSWTLPAAPRLSDVVPTGSAGSGVSCRADRLHRPPRALLTV